MRLPTLAVALVLSACTTTKAPEVVTPLTCKDFSAKTHIQYEKTHAPLSTMVVDDFVVDVLAATKDASTDSFAYPEAGSESDKRLASDAEITRVGSCNNPDGTKFNVYHLYMPPTKPSVGI